MTRELAHWHHPYAARYGRIRSAERWNSGGGRCALKVVHVE
jgi:hypothetical protein